MLTVCGGLIAIISAYAMLIPANEKFIPGLAMIVAAGGLAILLDILRMFCGLTKSKKVK